MQTDLPVRSGGHLPAKPDPDDETRVLFQSFREIFSASNQLERAVFWIEESRGRIILRHVRDLQRQSKGEDQLLGMFPNNLGSVRVAIGNFAAGAGLTTVRWEIHADFRLENLIGCGRFDFGDLLPDIRDYSDVRLKNAGLVGDWDFDSIVLTHQCPHCRKIYGRHDILYVSHKRCESCGQVPTFDQSKEIVQKLLKKFHRRLTAIAAHSLPSADGFGIQHFIDPIPNSIVYWLVTNWLHDEFRRHEHFSGDAETTIRQALNYSLFRHMSVDYSRKGFLEYLRGISETDWDIFVPLMGRLGKALEGGMKEKERQDLLSLVTRQYVQLALPHLINQVIVQTVSGRIGQ